MRALVQRVKKASVTIEQETVARIGPGLLVFLGVGEADEAEAIDYLAGKISRMRIFHDEAGKMNRDIRQAAGEVLVVSQFTLYGDMKRGNRPSFTKAAEPEKAETLYLDFCEAMRQKKIPVQTGQFAAKMEVELINDGPVTIWLESPGKAQAENSD